MRLNLVDGRLQEKIAEEVIAELKRDRSVVGIEICGSLARGETRPDSDIDIGVGISFSP